jgi:hypothetical protein
MGELFIRKLTDKDELWVCDDCGQEGLKASGKAVIDKGEMVMWFCYNCVERVKSAL